MLVVLIYNREVRMKTINIGDYCPENCQWTSIQFQQTHRCNTLRYI